MKSQQNYFCTKKDKNFIFPTKVIIKNKNRYLNFFYNNVICKNYANYKNG